jgi:ferredoxin-thioredoxin reductase catalytic subunit
MVKKKKKKRNILTITVDRQDIACCSDRNSIKIVIIGFYQGKYTIGGKLHCTCQLINQKKLVKKARAKFKSSKKKKVQSKVGKKGQSRAE